MNKKTSLITGIHGQDGYYLAKLLLEKNHRVVGLSRTQKNTPDDIEFIQADLTNHQSMKEAIKQINPDEIYNLASQSHPYKSWASSLDTTETNAIGAHRLFDIAFEQNPKCRIFQASSSQMFGDKHHRYHDEETVFYPSNPYAVSKLYAHHIANMYRKKYGYFISCGILYNHESPKRGMHFITQKLTYAAACIKKGIMRSAVLNELGDPIVNNGKLIIGSLNATRDWGHANDYVKAMWLMLQHDTPDNFIIATGINHSILDLCDKAFSYVGLNWKDHVETDERLARAEEATAIANINKIKQTLGWKPEINFDQLITSMVDFHLEALTESEKL